MAKAIYIQKGENINYLNSSENNILFGEVVSLVDSLGIAADNIQPGAIGSVEIAGVFQFPSLSTDVISIGQNVYWDETEKEITTTQNEGKTLPVVGFAVESKEAGATQIKVKIG